MIRINPRHAMMTLVLGQSAITAVTRATLGPEAAQDSRDGLLGCLFRRNARPLRGGFAIQQRPHSRPVCTDCAGGRDPNGGRGRGA